MSEILIGVPSTVVTTMCVELVGGVDAAERPQHDLGLALLERAAGDLDVLATAIASRTWSIGQAVRVELLDVDDEWISRARPPASDTSPTPSTDLERALDLLVGDLGERAQAHRPSTASTRVMTGIGVGVDLLDDRRLDLRRQVALRARDLLAHVLGGAVDVALEHELHRDLRRALGDALRDELVDRRRCC